MDLLPLEHFLAVVEEGSFSRAAERVFRTQPAVSQSIKKLEDELGTRLCVRDMHEVALTDAGAVLVEYARRMLALRDKAIEELAQLRTLSAGNVTIAAHESAALYLLPAPLSQYAEMFPGIKIEMYRSAIDEIPQKVLDREVDVGFVVAKPTFRQLRAVPIYSDRIVLVAPPNHPLAHRGTVRFDDLKEQPFLLHSSCKSTSRITMHLFRQYNIRIRVAAELSSFESMKTFLRQGVGVAFLPRLAVQRELHDGTLAEVALSGLDIRRSTLMICRGHRGLSHSARELFKVMRLPIDLGFDSNSVEPRSSAKVPGSTVPWPLKRAGRTASL